MTPAARVLLLVGSVTVGLTVWLWPRPASQVPAVERARPSAPEEVAARDASSVAVAVAAPSADAAAPSVAPVHAESASETELLAAAKARLDRDPAQALALIEAADRRFGAQNEARRALEIEALVKLERIGLSHAKAEYFFHWFPMSPAAKRIERLTGYHPRPWGPGDRNE